jgi:hypothetical protein
MLNRSSHGMLTQIILARWTEIHIQQRSKLSHVKLQWLTRFIGVTKISMPETVIDDIHQNITACALLDHRVPSR